MQKLFRTGGLSLGMLIAVTVMQLMGATSASAAPLCRSYDAFTSDQTTVPQKGTLCVAPSTDYPNYFNWARMTDGNPIITTNSSICGFSLFPYDGDEPQPLIACPAIGLPSAAAWRRVGNTWVRDYESSAYFQAGARVYVYPFGAVWRWVWTQHTGWRVVEARYVALRWMTST